MSIFSALRDAYSLEDAFQAKDCTSQAMREAIGEWFRLYYEREATEESIYHREQADQDRLWGIQGGGRR